MRRCVLSLGKHVLTESQTDDLENHFSETSRLASESKPAALLHSVSTTFIPSRDHSTPISSSCLRPRPARHRSSPEKSFAPGHLHNPVHSSSSAKLAHPTLPPLSRQTTYTSLPPSLRVDTESNFARGLGILELDEILEKLHAKAGPGMANGLSGKGTWSATSRQTTEGDGQDRTRVASESPARADEEKKWSGGYGIWDLLIDEVGAEEWDEWVVNGNKWCALSADGHVS